MRVLVVDSDQLAVHSLASELRRHGHDVDVASSGSEALKRCGRAEVVVTELELDDLDGVTVCRDIRSVGDVGVLVLSTRYAEIDRVLALRAGADDIVHKSIGTPELLARIEAIDRRSRPAQERERVIEHCSLEIDLAAYEVRLHGKQIEVTRKEFSLLKLLASERGQVVTRQRIMREVWQSSYTRTNGRTIDTHVNALRRKLGAREWIGTVRGIGFRIGSDKSLTRSG